MAFSVGRRPERDAEVEAALENFEHVTTGTIGHMTDFGYAHNIHPLVRPAKVVGLAYTVRLPHLDGVAVHYALSRIRPGEVLVIDTSGQRNRAAWGGVTAHAAAKAGVAAVVVDGPVTDWDEITISGPPVWCNGGTCSLAGRKMALEGAVQMPIQVGGAVVHPGDIVIADSDGVFFVRPRGSEAFAKKMRAREAAEPSLKLRLDNGELMADISGAEELAQTMLAKS